MDSSPPGSYVHGISPGKNTAVGCHSLLWGDVPNPGVELQEDSLLSEPLGKPKIALIQGILQSGVGGLFQ